MTSPAGTKRNTGSRSMNRLISHGHAMRSTRAFSRVTHFIDVLLSVYRVRGCTGTKNVADPFEAAPLQATVTPHSPARGNVPTYRPATSPRVSRADAWNGRGPVSGNVAV